MAAVRLIALHANKGRTIAQFMLQKRLYYQKTGRSIICRDVDRILSGKPHH